MEAFTFPTVPSQPVITIISSDGESFSLSASTVTHSHLLDGAVRRWAEVYQVGAAPAATKPHGSTRARPHNGRSGSLPSDNDGDATNTDVTAEDPEETPDEGFIEQYYDETASDLTAAGGMADEGLHTSPSRAAVTRDDGSTEAVNRPSVMRMVSVPANDVDVDGEAESAGTAADPAGATRTPRGLDDDCDGQDSDRTASVLPSSHEGSPSSSTTPTKGSRNSGDISSVSPPAAPTALLNGVAPRSIGPFVHGTPLADKTATVAPAALTAGHATGNGALSISGVSATHDAVNTESKNVLSLRSPVSRGSHPSPSTLMDADQSTPSVLSDEEAEENAAEGGGGSAATARPRTRTDPRNLGDEGLEADGAAGINGDTPGATAQLDGSLSRGTSSPSPEAMASGATTTTTTISVAAAARHADPLGPATTTTTPSPPLAAPAVHSSSGNSPLHSGGEPAPVSFLSCARLSERRHTGVVIQASDAAAGDDGNDDDDANLGGNTDPICARDAAGDATSNLGSHRSGGGGAVGQSTSASPAPDWRSPSSCHQRTPCIADEDDVGVMVGDEDETHERDTSPSNRVDSPATVGGGALGEHTVVRSGAGQTGSKPELTLPAAKPDPAALTASLTLADTAAAMAGPDTTVEYCGGVKITSGAIIVDLLQSIASPTPMVSPQSMREGAVSMKGAVAEAELWNPSSAGGVTVAGGEETTSDIATVPSTNTEEGSGQKLNIRSSTLMLCIEYMTHFAEAEAQAAAAAATAPTAKGRRRGHKRHRLRHSSSASSSSSSSSSSNTASSVSMSSEEDDEDNSSGHNGAAVSSTVSSSSLRPAAAVDVLPPGPGKGGMVVGGGVGAAAAARGPAGGPAAIAMPLSAPLVACISPWERTFLYHAILGAPDAVLTAAMAITEVCPNFDYGCPGPFLNTQRVRAALMTPPPPPEGVHTLMAVMAAARQLQIDPLHALCAGWLADFMIRVSYGATDNFEAAHLIRQFLRVPSHWTRRETDCLKLENEWPANEDAE